MGRNMTKSQVNGLFLLHKKESYKGLRKGTENSVNPLRSLLPFSPVQAELLRWLPLRLAWWQVLLCSCFPVPRMGLLPCSCWEEVEA